MEIKILSTKAIIEQAKLQIFCSE